MESVIAQQYSKFEPDFIERTYPTITSDISTAFSELVANAWDAGARTVNITVPDRLGESIIIEDDGTGMNYDEFISRWMVLAYKRVSHQGDYVEYPTSKQNAKRLAYGRNGAGRHALFCFDNEYSIETWKNGTCNFFQITTGKDGQALYILNHTQYPKDEHGTRLVVKAKKKIPQSSSVIKTLGYRFMIDPEFVICVNNIEIEYKKWINPISTDTIEVNGQTVSIEVFKVPEGEKSTASTGIAFWAGKRLVGNVSWSVGDFRVEDARRKFAQKHIILIHADHLIDSVEYDWSGFRNSQPVIDLYDVVISYIRRFRVSYYSERIDDVQKDIVRSQRFEIEKLSFGARNELSEFLRKYLEQKPEVDTADLEIITTALISVLNSSNGSSLIEKLATMSDVELTALDKILEDWSVLDIQEVLDEIDLRIKIIFAIESLCKDKTTDELHTLHPLVTQAKWLFGTEFDTPSYTSNKRVTTVLHELLKTQRNENESINFAKRPDLVIGATYSLASFSEESPDSNDIYVVSKVLIIELKKGGFSIGRKEMSQAEEYIDSIVFGNKLNARPKIKAYIVGDSIDSSISTNKKLSDTNSIEYGELHAYTYNQLVSTAEKRLFNLRDRLNDRYKDMEAQNIVNEILREPHQLKLETEK